MRKNELNYKELKNVCNPNMFNFETTAEITDNDLVYGQERGIKALEFGLSINSKGYNLYLEGPAGVGKTMYTKKYVTELASKKKTPDDWCYIYNFNDPNEPIAVSLSAGAGKEFKDCMDSFIVDIRKYLHKTFSNEDFEKEKNLIRHGFDEKKDKLLNNLNKQCLKFGFQVKSAQNGIYMMPVLDGKVIEEDEFENLDEHIKKDFEEKSNIVQKYIVQAIGQIKLIEKEADKKIDDWQANIALLTINAYINPIRAN